MSIRPPVRLRLNRVSKFYEIRWTYSRNLGGGGNTQYFFYLRIFFDEM